MIFSRAMSEIGTDRILVRKFTVGPFQENAYLVGCPETKEAIFVDPGDEADRLVAAVEESGLDLRAIWNTHAHIDHIGAVEPLKKRFGVPFLLHREEEVVERGGAFAFELDSSEAFLDHLERDEPVLEECLRDLLVPTRPVGIHRGSIVPVRGLLGRRM